MNAMHLLRKFVARLNVNTRCPCRPTRDAALAGGWDYQFKENTGFNPHWKRWTSLHKISHVTDIYNATTIGAWAYG